MWGIRFITLRRCSLFLARMRVCRRSLPSNVFWANLVRLFPSATIKIFVQGCLFFIPGKIIYSPPSPPKKKEDKGWIKRKSSLKGGREGKRKERRGKEGFFAGGGAKILISILIYTPVVRYYMDIGYGSKWARGKL